MRALVVINRNAGVKNTSENQVREALSGIFTSFAISPEFLDVPPNELTSAAAAAVEHGVDMVVASGGDGTISSVASALVGTEATLGVLPQGTLNHFAKDIGLPLDLADAAKVIARGHVDTVDVGEVNGRVFINNSSLGMYSHLAIERDQLRVEWKFGKWTAMGLAAFNVLRRFPMVSVRLEADENAKSRKTPLVFVGNNEYQFDAKSFGSRKRLTGGQLSLYIANTQSRWGVLRLSLMALFGGVLHAEELETSRHTELWITSRHRTLLVATDGEINRMTPPLHYRILPRALRVFTPGPQA